MSIKIGILLPRSDMFPTLPLDFLNGFRLALSVRGDNAEAPKLLIESIGNATGDSVLKTAEKMILQENVDLTISFCGIFHLRELVEAFTAYKKNLIHIDFGGNIINREHVSPFVIHHSLNLWQSAYRAGETAALEIGKNAAVAASFYDGGYHLVESFVRGFTAKGGTIIFPYVAPFDYKSESYQNLVDGLQYHKPDFVYSLFTHKEGQKVLKVLSEKLGNKDLPFIWSPLIDLRDEVSKDYALKRILSFSTWNFNSDEPEMQSFQNAHTKKFSCPPNLINLLGYEAALTVLNSVDSSGKLPPELGAFSSGLLTRGPRGELTYNSYHESQTPAHFVQQYDFTEQPYSRTVIKTLALNGEEKLYEQFKDLPVSGWQNPYIIT
ncbi:ABC transporter substrate-binding protein [Maribellus sp. CM-23]|uniref:ABC transporter substrate-binding protein n=1 Tax=Maribellus sp. CM-23 TaxID=2781026 RepID=UPI001F1693BF|nr:ABC transporter substrate-binding protein [Maribellus sp. CM-23]MCE4564243.1 ABC transporter substrate-binding protein [Maribellus sp. CM-23]